MDDNIKQLLKYEQEAQELINDAFLYKEKMKDQAIHDAQMYLQLRESENDQRLDNIKADNDQMLKTLEKHLDKELEMFKSKIEGKDLASLANELACFIANQDEKHS